MQAEKVIKCAIPEIYENIFYTSIYYQNHSTMLDRNNNSVDGSTISNGVSKPLSVYLIAT
jgi:hypothetical protein